MNQSASFPSLPRLPGYCFDNNIGRTRFPRSLFFDKLHEGVYYLTDKSHLEQRSRYPALYAWGELPPTPPWLALDRQRLKFKAYFQDSIHEGREPYRIRLVNISFFLEDGTLKVSEPVVDNSGLDQGVLVRRQRIPLQDPVKYRYYDILDLNIGMEPNIFGRSYKIYDCDLFTRHFLNRMGIPVPDPLPCPEDPARQKKNSTSTQKSYQKKLDKRKNFLRYDRKVLRFYGFWDDTDSPHGYVHDLEILYFLADDTMEVHEITGPHTKKPLVSRIKVPKFFTHLEPVGSEDPYTVLNVLGEDTAKGYYIGDNAYDKPTTSATYRDCDLIIGAHLNVFGRKITIIDLDNFTKEYYRVKYGLDDFTPLKRPQKGGVEIEVPRVVPPYNGFGTYEDSLANCKSFILKAPRRETDRFYTYENQQNDRRILRFGAKMISDNPVNDDRHFLVCIYLEDRTIAIFEVSTKKGGPKSMFLKRMKIPLPGQEVFSDKEPEYFEPQDFYIGACLKLNGFLFAIKSADEYTFNFMEYNCHEFPKADLNLIMNKIRENLKGVYREFIGKYSPYKKEGHTPIIRLSCLKEALKRYLGEDQITDHEIITVARRYTNFKQKTDCQRDLIRTMVHADLLRHSWIEFERLEEDIKHRDRQKTGYLGGNELYTILRACRIPLNRDLITLMLSCLHKNEEGKIDCRDLMKFLDIKFDPPPPLPPQPVKELYWTIEEKPKECEEIDWDKFIRDLDLEKELKEGEQKTED